MANLSLPSPSPSPSPTPRADHRAPTANVTHVSRKIIFTTGAHREGLSGQFSVFLCLLLNTLWGSYLSQLANAIPLLPSHHTAALLPLHTCHPIADRFPAPPHSSRTFRLVPCLPCFCCTFATCVSSELIDGLRHLPTDPATCPPLCVCHSAPAKRRPPSMELLTASAATS